MTYLSNVEQSKCYRKEVATKYMQITILLVLENNIAHHFEPPQMFANQWIFFGVAGQQQQHL